MDPKTTMEEPETQEEHDQMVAEEHEVPEAPIDEDEDDYLDDSE